VLTSSDRNQTNLALKGIIALKAVSELAKTVGQKGAADTWGAVAQMYLDFWYDHGINKDATKPHTNLQYDRPESHGTRFSLLHSSQENQSTYFPLNYRICCPLFLLLSLPTQNANKI